MKPCNCGSGQDRETYYDGYGIFLFSACTACYMSKRSKYRDDIFERYSCDEPIEEE
jgi:hypothetical protein